MADDLEEETSSSFFSVSLNPCTDFEYGLRKRNTIMLNEEKRGKDMP